MSRRKQPGRRRRAGAAAVALVAAILVAIAALAGNGPEPRDTPADRDARAGRLPGDDGRTSGSSPTRPQQTRGRCGRLLAYVTVIGQTTAPA